ncbi:MAG: hypothetical protein Q8P05_03175 [Candidatus Diapherotrites archaeon]|nr:hypothetical protein [Candidatus Diapherotrites archaeon]MDZ4256461.1 hypothetical protein [archaeon]
MPPIPFKEISWKDALAEGEKRIQERFLDALVRMDSRSRAGMLAQRERLDAQIREAISKEQALRFPRLFRKQVHLLWQIERAQSIMDFSPASKPMPA